MKPRTSYTTDERKKVLYAYASGKTPQEALELINPNVNNPTITDSRHAVKLLNKWKQEIYAKKEYNININENCNNVYFNILQNNSKNNPVSKHYANILKEKSKEKLNPTPKKPINEKDCTLVEKSSLEKEYAIAKKYFREQAVKKAREKALKEAQAKKEEEYKKAKEAVNTNGSEKTKETETNKETNQPQKLVS